VCADCSAGQRQDTGSGSQVIVEVDAEQRRATRFTWD
jgi:hypothetical protein